MIEPSDPEIVPPSRPLPRERGSERERGAREDRPGGATDFTVRLERVFQGPLDLLLQLVREKELEIHAVSLAQVCDAYCRHVRAIRELDVDEAADYLVLAATLLAIKSRSLLPQEEIEADEDPFDPGEELVQHLLAYKELRAVAETLGERRQQRAALLPAGGRWLGRYERDDGEEEEEWELGEISIWDLLRLFRRLEEETGFSRPHRVRQAGKPLSHYVETVWSRLQREAEVSLLRLLKDSDGVFRADAAYFLVALLELAKQEAVDLEQDEPFADVRVTRAAGAVELHLDQLDEQFDHPPSEPDPEIGELLLEDED